MTAKSDDGIAENKPCKECGKTAEPVFRTNDNPAFRGWFCPQCGYFDQATGRERGLKPAVKP